MEDDQERCNVAGFEDGEEGYEDGEEGYEPRNAGGFLKLEKDTKLVALLTAWF